MFRELSNCEEAHNLGYDSYYDVLAHLPAWQGLIGTFFYCLKFIRVSINSFCMFTNCGEVAVF